MKSDLGKRLAEERKERSEYLRSIGASESEILGYLAGYNRAVRVVSEVLEEQKKGCTCRMNRAIVQFTI